MASVLRGWLKTPHLVRVVVAAVLLVGGFAPLAGRTGIAAEPDNLHDLTVDLGGSPHARPAPTGVVREFELVAQPARWEIAPGVTVDAVSYNGQVPGPEIRVTEGDTLRVVLRNELSEPTSIHWHGLHVPNAMDGVPGVTQDAVLPGESFTYEFVVSHAGTFMYHTHGPNSAAQMDGGLYGPLIVEPQPGATQPTTFDREYVMMLSAWTVPPQGSGMEEHAGSDHAGMSGMETPADPAAAGMQMNYNYFTINGKAYPAISPWTAEEGDLIRVRIMNVSNLVHPMHLHGMDFKVVAKDGESLPPAQQTVMNNLPVNAGETYDVVILADSAGTWIFHCHELHHVENDGVEPGGLIQPLVVEPATA